MDRQSIRLMTFPTHTIIIVKIPSISLCGFFARNSPSENYRLGYHIFSCTQNVALLQKIGSLFRLFFLLGAQKKLLKSTIKIMGNQWQTLSKTALNEDEGNIFLENKAGKRPKSSIQFTPKNKLLIFFLLN